MFARESSTHGQMKPPSIAQRGEGGAGGGSGELSLLPQASHIRSVMPHPHQASALALSASVVKASAKNSSSGKPPSAW